MRENTSLHTKRQENMGFLIVCCSFLVFFSIIFLNFHNSGSFTGRLEYGSKFPIRVSLSDDSVIFLDGNAAIASFCSVGNGTSSNPYVIENYVIDAVTMNGITLKNIKVHTLIRNCSIRNADSAILMENCANITIQNTNTSNNYYGLYLLECNSIQVNHSYFENETFGVIAKYSESITVHNNTFYDCLDGLFLVWDTIYTNITGNQFPKTTSAVSITSATHTVISYNNISRNMEGIRIQNGDYNTILFNDVSHNAGRAITITYSTGNIIIGNNCSNSGWEGMGLQSISNSLIKDNNCSLNYMNDIHFWALSNSAVVGNIMEGHGFTVSSLYNVSIDTTNLVNGKPVYYYHDQKDLTLSEITDVGQLILANCTNITVEQIEIDDCGAAIILDNSHYSTIRFNNLVNNSCGIVLQSSQCNQIYGNSITSQIHKFGGTGSFFNYGIGLQASGRNKIYDNYVKSQDNGLVIEESQENELRNNTCLQNRKDGIYVYKSDDCIITENHLVENSGAGVILRYTKDTQVKKNTMKQNKYGISLDSVSDCEFLMNLLIDNDEQPVYIEDYSHCPYCVNLQGENTWKGNFYSDYRNKYPNAYIEENGVIWSIPYYMDENNTDNYPLVDPSLMINLEKLFKTERIINITLMCLSSGGIVVLISVIVKDKIKYRTRPIQDESIEKS